MRNTEYNALKKQLALIYADMSLTVTNFRLFCTLGCLYIVFALNLKLGPIILCCACMAIMCVTSSIQTWCPEWKRINADAWNCNCTIVYDKRKHYS